ncbi:MAG TPA: hypothetical protein VMY37_04430 [Thermoguttaceae bacterium]|nr:hypothetical protein [Thermoguttaceae bacterium]
MSLSEQVAELEQEKADLRAGWRNDLEVLISLALRGGDFETAKAAERCLANV